MNNRILTVSALILAAALFRLLPHAPNFSPIGAIALFGGAYLTKKWMAFLVPVLAMLVSDMFLGFYGMEMLITYGALVLIIGLGNLMQGKVKWYTVGLGSIASSFIFYLVTNLVWLYPSTHGAIYPHSLQGQVASYIAAWPFFQNTFLSDLVYNTMLFGSFYLLQVNVPSLRLATLKEKK